MRQIAGKARLRSLAVLRRFLSEWDDVPAPEASKRLACGALAVLCRRLCHDRRCRLGARELLALPPA